MASLIQDFRYALRVLIKSPGFTIVAVLALAVGIGANSAIFSIVNSILLRPLPYAEPDRLVMLWQDHRARGGPEREWPSPLNFADWRDQNRSFERVSSLVQWGPTLTGQGDPEDLVASGVSYDMFETLGVSPALGRTFRIEEDRQGAQRVVMLSDAIWKHRFGGDPNIIGSTLTLGGENFNVIGVMPAGFKFPVVSKAQLWTTINSLIGPGCGRACLVLRVIARLKQDVTLESAGSDMKTLAANLEQAYPEANNGIGATLITLREQEVGNARLMLLALLGAVALVLLIACVNVANLLLAKASAREREMSIRTALGASRTRLIRQLLTESMCLALAGGVLGLLLGFWLLDLLVSFAPPGTPRVDEIGIDRTVLLFTFAIAVGTGILFGVAPAFHASKTDLNNSLKEGKGVGAGVRGNKMRSVLVVVEVTGALTLLIVAGLLVRSFINLMKVDPGFNPSGVLTMGVGLPRARYSKPEQTASYYANLMEQLKGLPGVEAAGAISTLPLGGGGTDTDFVIEGRPAPPPGNEPVAWYSSVTTGYFKTMGMRLIKGREFTDQDVKDSKRVVVISQMMADRYFPDEEALGKRIGNGGKDNQWTEIVGVVADVKHFGLDSDARPTMYYSENQLSARGMNLMIRAKGDLLSLVASIRARVESLDSNLAVSNVRTMEQVRDDSIGAQRFLLLLLGVFSSVAVLLAALGIYGVISYSVAQRTQEIGIRMALGADRSEVMKLIVSRGMGLTLIGVVAGVTVAFICTQWLQALLFEVQPRDVVTFAVIPVLLMLIALCACVIPARRAMRIDPMQALRCE